MIICNIIKSYEIIGNCVEILESLGNHIQSYEIIKNIENHMKSFEIKLKSYKKTYEII